MTIVSETHCKLAVMYYGGRSVGSGFDVADRGEEVWAEVGDGSCRWRQTASEVTLLCLGVPPHTPAKQLQVTLDPYFIKGTVLPFIIHFPSFSVVRHGHLPTKSLSLMLHLSACCLLPVHTSCLSYKLYVTAALSWVFCLLHGMVPCSGGQSEWWGVPGGALGAGHCPRGECVGAWWRCRREWLSAIPAQDEPATAAQVGTLHCVNCAKHAVVPRLMPIFVPDFSWQYG